MTLNKRNTKVGMMIGKHMVKIQKMALDLKKEQEENQSSSEDESNSSSGSDEEV